MTRSRLSAVRLSMMVVIVATVVLMGGCGALGGDQNTFSPSGDVAQKQFDLFVLVLIPAVLILVGVTGALLYILIRFRRRDGDGIPAQIHGNDRLEVGWTIAPVLLLIGVAVPTIAGIIDLGRDAKDDALHVRAVAFRWDWKFEYLDPEFATADGDPLSTDNLYIPVDREVGIELKSLDVIHSFWTPRLAGKLDVMPGRTNKMWFNATEAGVYNGQCAEFCGLNHAFMKFTTTALEPAQFDACMDAIAEAGDNPLPDECEP